MEFCVFLYLRKYNYVICQKCGWLYPEIMHTVKLLIFKNVPRNYKFVALLARAISGVAPSFGFQENDFFTGYLRMQQDT